MQKLFNFLMVGLAFAVLNVATVTAQDNFVDPDCAPGTPAGTICDDPAAGGADGKTFVDPDCPPGSPPGTICDDPAAGGSDGKTFVDPDCAPGTPAGTIC